MMFHALKFQAGVVGLLASALLRAEPVAVAPSVSPLAEEPAVAADIPSFNTAPAVEFVPAISVASPWSMVLDNGTFTIPYTETMAGVPAIHLGVALPYGNLGNLYFSVQGRVGYGTRQGGVTAIHDRSGVKSTEQVRLHWMPISVAHRVTYQIPGISFMKPSLAVGGGVQMLAQSGKRAGIDHSFWLPFVYVTPALTFLEGNPVRDWFGGFTFGTSIESAVGTPQTLRGWSFDMSFSIYL